MHSRYHYPETVLPAVDRSVPLVIMKVGHHPMGHNGLFLARSAGRVGIPVIAMVESNWTPLAVSRYVGMRVPALAVDATRAEVIMVFADLQQRLGRRPVVAATDDEGAVMLDEFGEELSAYARIPAQRAGMSRWVASKAGLVYACQRADVICPRTEAPASAQDVVRFAEVAMFPVVVKNREAFTRIQAPGVTGTSVMKTQADLLRFARTYDGRHPVVLQEYLPEASRVNCIFQAYRRSHADDIVSFTGMKVRDWPVGRGESTLTRSQTDLRLKAWGEQVLRRLDYRGVCGMDVLLDTRDDTFKLIDFNPRFAANAAMFTDEDGLDLVRAYHLDMTGRWQPQRGQVDDVWFQVETKDRHSLADGHPVRYPERGTVLAFGAADDRRPRAIAGARILAGNLRAALRRRG